MNKKRIEWIDISKGVAIICVVIGHVVSSYHESGMYLNNTWWNFIHQFVYSFHMPLFMLLSGVLYGLSSKNSDKPKQVKKTVELWTSLHNFFSTVGVNEDYFVFINK